jgi:drug/metabolite transporter (DMT)-like permease
MASRVEESRPTKIDTEPSWRTLLAVTITVLAWASAFVVIRYAAHDIRPGALSLGRLLVASVALSTMMIGRRLVRLNAREWALTAVVGIAWFAVYSVALNAGEQHVDAGTAAMLIQFAPILIGVLAGILLGEGFPRMLVIGGLVAFAGTLIIGIATSTGKADLIGVLLVLLSATTYSIALVAQKVVLRRVSALQVTWLACLIGTIDCLPFAGQLVHDLAAAPPLQIAGVV